MSRAPALVPQIEISLTVLNGPDKGAVYKLMGHKITLGRSSENDVVIQGDPKVSRKHAKISVTPNGIIITNMSERNPMAVNQQETRAMSLVNDNLFTLGETKFRFNLAGGVPPVSQSADLSVVPQGLPPQMPGAAPLPGPPGGGDFRPDMNPPPQAPKTKKKRSPVFNFLVGFIIFVVFLLLLDNPNSKKEEKIELRGQTDFQDEIENLDKDRQKLIKQRQETGRDSDQYRYAQSFYIRGFRDYRQGQYERAMEAFQACLSTFPSHGLCQRYLKLSQKKFSELTQYHMILGRKYKSQAQYRACANSFENVMTMVKDTNNPIYKEALANYKACKALFQERF